MYLSDLLFHLTCNVVQLAKRDQHGEGRPTYDHPIRALFSMEMSWFVQCNDCGGKVTGNTHETILRLPLPRELKKLRESDEVWDVAEEISALQGEQNIKDYQCDHCKKKCPATRKEYFSSIPTVLMIQLLIFNNDCEKILVRPSIPQEISCTDLGGCSQCMYSLCCTVEHVGTTLECGHYIVVSVQSNGRFVVYDDDVVQYRYPKWKSLTPYLLFYELMRCERHKSLVPDCRVRRAGTD